MHAERDNRIIHLTDIPSCEGIPMGDMSITIQYEGDASMVKGASLDNVVIPAIVHAINVEKRHKDHIAQYQDFQREVGEHISKKKKEKSQHINIKTLKVEKEKAETLERFCKEPPGDCGRGEAIFDEEVKFDDGRRMAIQVIASEEPDKESCWTQGVLFNSDGNELGCTDVGESFLGEYQVDDYGVSYIVTVEI